MQRKIILYLFCLLAIAGVLSGCSTNRSVAVSQPAVSLLSFEEQRQRDYYFYEAIRLKETGKYDEAIETLLLCAALDPYDAGIQAELGVMYALIDMNEQAVVCLENAVRAQPSNWWHSLRLISFYSEIGMWNTAIKHADNLRGYYPHRKEIYNILGALYTQNNEIEKAIEAYDKLENFAGITEQISLEKFRLYLAIEKEKKAVAEIDRLVLKYSTESRYRVLQGNIYIHLKQKEKAFAIFQEVLQNDPENPYVYLALSEYYSSENDEQKSLEAIESALKSQLLDIDTKIDILEGYIEGTIQDTTKHEGTESLLKLLVEYYPLEEKVHAYLAIFLRFCERNDEALEVLETMLNINPKNDQTWGEIIQIHFLNEDYDQVLLATQRAIEQLPNIPQWYFYRGTAYFQSKDYRQAIAACLQGVELVPDEQPSFKSTFYSQIADAHFKLKEKEQAFEAYEKALSIHPSNIYVMNNYAYYLSEEKQDLKKAERMSAKTVEKEPNNSTYLDTYAWIFYQQGNYSLAKFYIERALDNSKDRETSGVILDHYGDILWVLREDEKALEMWQRAYDEGEQTEEVKQKIENKGWERE